MRVKVARGSAPLPLFDYLFRPDKQIQASREQLQVTGSVQGLLIVQTIPGMTAKGLARNFGKISKLNPKVKKTVAHYSISLPGEDNEKVGKTEIRQISQALLDQLGHRRSPYVGIEHHDTDHRHWHLAASTVSYDGSWVDDSYERHRIRTVERALEVQFGLKQSPVQPASAIKNLSTGEYRLKRRTQKAVPKEKLWAAIDDCIQRSSSLERFIIELRVRHPDVSIRFKKKNGKHVGISFATDGIAFAGRSLGRAYSLHGLSLYHGINQNKTLVPFVDELLSLSDRECQDLHAALENRSDEVSLNTFSIDSGGRGIAKSQIEA